LTELKWGLFAPCINEIELIEAKLEWALERFDDISIVEGHHKHYKNVSEVGLSVDGTSEILQSYSDRIKYNPVGIVNVEGTEEFILRDTAYQALNKDLDVVVMCDIDEFWLDKDLDFLDEQYLRNKNLKLTATNSLIFLDNEYCAKHIQRNQGTFAFDLDDNGNVRTVNFGQWHERIFRYNEYYRYDASPFLINDMYGRFIFSHQIYFNERKLFPEIYMLHYKNFKRAEAEKRTEMYNTYNDNVKHDTEWDELELKKFKYDGEHPEQIKRLL